MAEKSPEATPKAPALQRQLARVRLSAAEVVLALILLLALIGGTVALVGQSRTLHRVAQQTDRLEQQSTTSQDLTRALSERVDHLESELASPEFASTRAAAELTGYADRLDRKTATLINVVLAIAILAFTVVALTGVLLVHRKLAIRDQV